MLEFYDENIIPVILNIFNVSNLIISGVSNNKNISLLLNYCNEEDVQYTLIDHIADFEDNFIKDFPINVLPNLFNYDAIFLDDDANWYTVFNELKFIKQNNENFPLVFISNCVFPNKRRDSYIDPNIIPKKYINEFCHNLSLVYEDEDIIIDDGLFHAKNENTPNNGVLTAIEDFINLYDDISIMDLNLYDGTIILYPKNNITYFKFNKILEKGFEHQIKFNGDIVDVKVKNKLLLSYINKFNDFEDEYNQKSKIIDDYKNKIEIHDYEIDLMNSRIDEFYSKLNLKEAQLKNAEVKLSNKSKEIEDLNDEIQKVNLHITSLEKDLEEKKFNHSNQVFNFENQIESLREYLEETENNFSKREYELNNQIKIANHQINNNELKLRNNLELISQKDYQLSLKDKELNNKQFLLDSLEQQNLNNLSKLNSKEYCISCYKEQLSNNNLEIQYLKKNNVLKKFFIPLNYLYLFFKSNPKELFLNFKLYKALKNSKCFDIGYYVRNNEDIKKSKWYNYFSLELHYVCHGFNENRKFNKKYFNRTSKKELLEYISNCQ